MNPSPVYFDEVLTYLRTQLDRACFAIGVHEYRVIQGWVGPKEGKKWDARLRETELLYFAIEQLERLKGLCQ